MQSYCNLHCREFICKQCTASNECSQTVLEDKLFGSNIGHLYSRAILFGLEFLVAGV